MTLLSLVEVDAPDCSAIIGRVSTRPALRMKYFEQGELAPWSQQSTDCRGNPARWPGRA